MKAIYIVSRWTPTPCVAFVSREAADAAARAAGGRTYLAPLADAFCGKSAETENRFDDYEEGEQDGL